MSDTEEEDPAVQPDHVVREVPVFLSKSLSNQLYIIQYHLRPASITSDTDNILQAKIKPNQDRIQLTVGIDTSSSYDKRKGESMGRSAVGPASAAYYEELEEQPVLNEYIMESSPLPSSCRSSRYVVGVLRDGQIHLSSLKSIVQMKGTFSHLDDADKHMTKGDLDGGDDSKPTKVMVKFSQHRDHPMSKSRFARSYVAARKKLEEETWIELNYFSKDLDESEKLFSVVKESDTPFYVVSRRRYANEVLPKHVKISAEGSGEKKVVQPTRLLISQLKRLSLPEQLRHIMKSAKVLRHSQVVEYLKTKLKVVADEASVLRSIQTVAVLVQGCWVVKSDVLYPPEFISDSNGLSALQMQRARDYILSLYTTTRVLERKSICAQTRIPMDEVTEIISDLGKVVPRTGWEFIYPFDSNFVISHEDVAQRQAIMWEMKVANRNRTTSLDLKSSASTSVQPRRRSRSRHVSFSSYTDSRAEPEAELKREAAAGKSTRSVLKRNP